MTDLDLLGRTALVTGVSRRAGIGYAVAVELARRGANLFVQHYAPHDAAQPWGGDDLAAVRAGVRAAMTEGALLGDLHADLRDPRAAHTVIEAASALTGTLHILVCNQALSGTDGTILEQDTEMLDAHWQTNARATLLLTSAFARQGAAGTAPFDAETTRRVVWLTSGQQDAPMPDEIAYAASKAALAGVTPSVAKTLLQRGIVLNTVNPGPVDTGYLDPATTDRDLTGILAHIAATPFGRFGAPADPARLIGWLVSPAGGWVVGQVLRSDGGFALG